MTLAKTADRGYSSRHRKKRESLFAQLEDGTPCPECGEPMYRDATKNFDRAPLEADHPKGYAQKYADNKRANLPRRLIHRRCNRSGGSWDKPHSTPSTPPRIKKRKPSFTW